MMQTYLCEKLTNQEILKIYTEIAPDSFPQEELRPLSNINSMMERGGYEGLGLFTADTHTLCGYAFFIRVPDMTVALLDFYAILREYRCLGLGSLFLQKIKEYYNNLEGLLLETEDTAFAADAADLALRQRRNAFYFKNGVRQTAVCCSVFDNPFTILFFPTASTQQENIGQTLTDEEIKSYLDSIYRFMLPGEWYTKGVVWRNTQRKE